MTAHARRSISTFMTHRTAACVLLAAGLAAAGCAERRGQGLGLGLAIDNAPTLARATAPAEPPTDANRFRKQIEVSALREQALGVLVQLASSRTPQIRANALEGLVPASGRLEPLAAAALTDSNEGVRAVACMVVGRAELDKLADSVRPLTSDASPYVRASAIYAMRELGQSVDPTPISALLLDHPSTRVRAHAAFILGELGDRSALPMLRQAAAEPVLSGTPIENRLLQLQIAEAMVKLGEDEQRQVLRAALYPARPEELEAAALAAQIIGEVDDRMAIDQLVGLVTENRRGRQMPAEVRLSVAGALAKLGQDGAEPVAAEYQTNPTAAIRAQAASVFGETGSREALAPLESLLADESELVRASAASAILHIAGGRSRASAGWRR